MHAFRSLLSGFRTTAHGFRYTHPEIRSRLSQKTTLFPLLRPLNCPDFGQPPFSEASHDGSY